MSNQITCGPVFDVHPNYSQADGGAPAGGDPGRNHERREMTRNEEGLIAD